MILAKREFNKLKYRVCCGMLSTVDEFFIFVCNGTLPVFLSIKVKWSGFSLSPLKFLRSGEFNRNTTKQMIVTSCVRAERNHETILLSGVLPGANQIFRFLVLCHSLYFWCQIIQWLEKSLLDIHLLVPLKAGNRPKLKKCHAMYKIIAWHHGSWLLMYASIFIGIIRHNEHNFHCHKHC